MNQKTGVVLLLLGLGVAFMTGGCVATAFSAQFALDILQSPNWPTTQGVVEATNIDIRTGQIRTVDGQPSGLYYTPEIVYRYTVAGEEYRNDTFGRYISESYDRRSDAEAYLAQFPVGATVTVFYKPSDPSVAVLEAGGPIRWYFPLFGALGSLLLGLLCLVAVPFELARKVTPATPPG